MRRHPQASAGVRLRQLCAALVGAAGVYALINMHQGLELHQEAVPHSVPRPRTVPVRELRQQAREVHKVVAKARAAAAAQPPAAAHAAAGAPAAWVAPVRRVTHVEPEPRAPPKAPRPPPPPPPPPPPKAPQPRPPPPLTQSTAIDESYHVVFSTGCSEFQDWQSIGVFSSAEAVGQRGVITRIASGCSDAQKVSISHAMSHLPPRCRVFYAPDTTLKDHAGRYYKYANKPLGMMHWLDETPIPGDATIALIDPDFYFLRPLWHDSFDDPAAYFATGGAKSTPFPAPLVAGTMIAQRYGIGGKPWTRAPGRNGQKDWKLAEYLASVGRPASPAAAADLTESRASTFYSIGAPYIALAADWRPIATNWTHLMPMAVARNFGNLAEMYAMVVAVADLGIRPAMINSMMVSNTGAGDEAWPWVDAIPKARTCDPAILTDDSLKLPHFLHYCQRYEHVDKPPYADTAWIFSKYQVPDEILQCPAGSASLEDAPRAVKKTGGDRKRMKLADDGFLPEPPVAVDYPESTKTKRNVFSFCIATRRTNLAARDYRRWFCEQSHAAR